VLTDYHVHLRPDEDDSPAQRYFTEANVDRYREAAHERGIEELGVAEHIHRFTQSLDVWTHAWYRHWAADDVDEYVDFLRAAQLKVGVEADFLPGREDRLANFLDAREWDYVVGSVHFLRETLGHVRKDQQGMVAALLRPTFNADTGEQARELVGDALERLRKPLPKVAALLEEAEEDLLAFYAFPTDHWPKLRSTNPLERVNREIGRRTDVVGIFPNDRSLIRLAASVVIEQNDEWLVGRRYLSAHSMEPLLDNEKETKTVDEEVPTLTTA